MRAIACIVGVMGGAVLSALLIALMGVNPADVLLALLRGSLGSQYGLSQTVFYTTSLTFTGLAVALAFRAGLFNIGVEGQAYIGALFGWLVAYTGGGITAAIVASALGGALFALVPATLRERFGAHEVITTILLNFVALYLIDYLVNYPLKDPALQSPHTPELGTRLISIGTLLGLSYKGNWNVSFVLALVCAGVCEIIVEKTRPGFRLRAVGENPEASRRYGVNVGAVVIGTMCASGAIAGLVAVNCVLGAFGRLGTDISPGYGFIGIGVALVAGNRPLAVPASALLFALLMSGALEVDFETQIDPRVVLVVEGLVLMCVVCVMRVWRRRW